MKLIVTGVMLVLSGVVSATSLVDSHDTNNTALAGSSSTSVAGAAAGAAVVGSGNSSNTNINAPSANGGSVKNDNTDVNVNGQTQTANGGTGIGIGGTGGTGGKGGNAEQGQSQIGINDQDQSQSLKNSNDLTNVGVNEQGQKQGQDQTAVAVAGQSQSNKNTNQGNSLSGNLSVVTEAVRQVPSVAQGSFAIQGCGAAGNLGGSNNKGAGFLGFGFTPRECYLYQTAQAYQAIGETRAACLMINETKAAKRAAKRGGFDLPSCEPAPVLTAEAIVYPTPAEIDLSAYATREELNTAVTRAFTKSQSK